MMSLPSFSFSSFSSVSIFFLFFAFFLPIFSLFSVFFRFIFRKNGDTVRETPFAKPRSCSTLLRDTLILICQSLRKRMGKDFLLTVGVSLLTVRLLCSSQSLKALIRRTLPLYAKAPTVSKKAKAVSKKTPIESKNAKLVNCM